MPVGWGNFPVNTNSVELAQIRFLLKRMLVEKPSLCSPVLSEASAGFYQPWAEEVGMAHLHERPSFCTVLFSKALASGTALYFTVTLTAL